MPGGVDVGRFAASEFPPFPFSSPGRCRCRHLRRRLLELKNHSLGPALHHKNVDSGLSIENMDEMSCAWQEWVERDDAVLAQLQGAPMNLFRASSSNGRP
ncbi:hypothetical protein GGR56DRAFT_348707 [Xylariaceae sp. FL0804]|nr:hypothetical protein GGR56DRAFT_348707 [Xylariaceae sp. FL0804]